jgi:hypothetical protein
VWFHCTDNDTSDSTDCRYTDYNRLQADSTHNDRLQTYKTAGQSVSTVSQIKDPDGSASSRMCVTEW